MMEVMPVASQPIYQFYAELKDYKPLIWRRFQVAGNITLAQLGYVTMTLFEMKGSHLFHLEYSVNENMPDDDPAYQSEPDKILRYDIAGGDSLYGDNVIEKHGINRDRTGDREKTRYLRGKQGIFTRDRALIRPGFIRQLETRASTRSASFFHALGSPGRPHNGGGAAGAYCTSNGAKPLKQGHLRAKRGPLGPSRKSQQQTKRTGFAAHGHSIAETAPEGKRASCANGALIRA